MGNLFWKIFLWFWLTLILIGAGVSWATAIYLQNSDAYQQQDFRTRIISSRVELLREVIYYGGEEGPTLEKMRQLIARLEWFNEDLVPEETVKMRYEQSLNPEEMALAASSDSPRGDWQDLSNELRNVQCPTLFCWGMQDDFLTPDYPLMLTNMVQRGQLHILDASSHHLQEERPEHYYHIVSSFLAQPEPVY